ncbi:hypothetical protein [uncultured Desulfovibrio sp.]|uniref:hypothetical protein n=1 Tax=uncultured Desulfovibrio sp. TaxID=167968 RepID=UPI00261B47C7|nr:hypothetical protein [uncultured Desulfovibrio sp.]
MKVSQEGTTDSYRAAMHELTASLQKEHSMLLKALFPQIKGKKVVIAAAGKSGIFFQPIKETIYIGINSAYRLKNIPFDFIFIQDNINLIVQDLLNNNRQCNIVCGQHVSYPNIRIEATFPNNLRYYVASVLSGSKQKFTSDIQTSPISDFTSTIFSALQIILACQPAAIYLVGCDCSGVGNVGGFSIRTTYNRLIPCWRKFADFVRENYPSVQISSIHPIGLRGLFKNIYQNDKVEEFLSLMRADKAANLRDFVKNFLEDKNCPPAWTEPFCETLFRLGYEEEAIHGASELLRRYPSYLEGYRLLLNLATKNATLYDGILAEARRALEAAPDAHELRATLAVSLLKRGCDQEAQELVIQDNSAAFKTCWMTQLIAAGGFFSEKGNYTKALRCYREILSQDSSDRLIRTWSHAICIRLGNYREAHTLIHEGLALDADWANGYALLASTYEKEGERKKARAAWHKAMEKAPLALMYRARLARFFRSQHNFDATHALLDEALSISPDWLDGHYQKALTYEAAGDLPKALNSAWQAVELLPPELTFERPVREYLASLLIRSGRPAAARTMIQQTLEITPEWGGGWMLLAKLAENEIEQRSR